VGYHCEQGRGLLQWHIESTSESKYHENKPTKFVLQSLSLAAMLVSVSVFAQTPTKVDSSPPKLEQIDEIRDTGVSASKPKATEKEKIVEKRAVGGKVTEVEVNTGKSNYVLKANPEYGNNPAGTVQGTSNRPAMWKVMEFGGKKETKEHEAPPALAPASSTAESTAASAAAATAASKPVKK